ncbi:MAG: hypothetical protein ACKVX7_19175 [Planctomycetota bacterium]
MTSRRICFALLILIAGTSVAGADVITDWNNRLLDAIRSTSLNPPRASRAMALLHTAMFDAVNGSTGLKHVPYHVNGSAQALASTTAAASAAARSVMAQLFPTLAATFDSAHAADIAGIPTLRKNRGVAWGNHVAEELLALRSADGSATIVPYVPFVGPGFWVPTPPAFAGALLPNWPDVTPWAMTSGDQFRQAGPPSLTSDAYTLAFNEVKELGRSDSATRTADQTQIAFFWADGGGTATPPGHWQLIAQTVSEDLGFNLRQNARLFALLSIAAADAAICAWDHKYEFNHWRPITGIHEAANDGNDDTDADLTWTALIATPPFPAYTSGHSTFSSSAAKIIERFIGTDEIEFSTTSDALPGIMRSFASLSDAASEAGQSRIYGGIHWQYDNLDALNSGTALGEFIAETQLRLLGDIDLDDEVDVHDLLLLLGSLGPCPDCAADLNGNGVVNIQDLLMLVFRFT